MRSIGLDRRQRQVAIHRRIAMTGEMLGRSEYSILRIGSRARDERADMLGHNAGVLSEGSDIDDGIVRIAVDVGDGKKDPVDAQRARVAGRNLAGIFGGLRIARRGECHRVRE